MTLGLEGIVDKNAAIARDKHPTPDVDPRIASGTHHNNLGERTKLVAEDGRLVQKTIDERAFEQMQLDAIEVEKILRAKKDTEAKERLERANNLLKKVR